MLCVFICVYFNQIFYCLYHSAFCFASSEVLFLLFRSIYMFVLYVSLCVSLGWILNRFRFMLFRSHQLSLVGQVSLYLAMHLVSVKFCASSLGYTLEASERVRHRQLYCLVSLILFCLLLGVIFIVIVFFCLVGDYEILLVNQDQIPHYFRMLIVLCA